jgi:Domain of unknown function (DUF4440)
VFLVDEFFAALDRGDRSAVRLALHPYVRWTRADGTVLVGRNRVLEMIASDRPSRPASVELRDGQIYRWTDESSGQARSLDHGTK